MTAAEPVPAVQVALAQAASAVGAIAKADENSEQGFKYRGIERILAAVGPALHRAGVVVLPEVIDVHREEMLRGARQNVWRLITLTIRYRFVGPAGDELCAVVMGEGLDNGDKAVSKAFTMAYKVALLQALQIADAETDPDASSPPEQVAGPPEPELLSRQAVDRVAAACRDAGFTLDETAEMVSTATNGRATTLQAVLAVEFPALREAKAAIVARKTPAEPASDDEDPGRPM